MSEVDPNDQEKSSGAVPKIAIDFKDIAKSFDMYFDRVKEENTLINNRLTWLITVQSFMIAGVSIVYSYYLQTFAPIIKEGIQKTIVSSENTIIIPMPERLDQLKSLSDQAWQFIMTISGAGFLISLTSIALLIMASLSIRSLEDEWNNNGFSNIRGEGDGKNKKFLPNLTNGSRPGSSLPGVLFGLAIPFIFALIWVALLMTFSINKLSL